MSNSTTINGAGFKAIVAGLADEARLEVRFDSGILDSVQMRRGQVRRAYLKDGVLVIESGDSEC